MRAETIETEKATGMRRTSAALAIGLALLLTFCWSISDWVQISALRLPDNDDMMRLAQVRDLLAGQRFDDWTQYRLAPPDGAPMHWSRLGDLGIAALILIARPLVGGPAAELFAVIAYPAILFGCFLLLSGRVGARIGGESARPLAIVLAALAYPAVGLFIPGRIDHHALQIVLVLGIVDRVGARPTLANGAVTGALVGLSMGLGLETAPQIGALVILLVLFWVWRGTTERNRLGAFAVALGGTTALLLLAFRPSFWSAGWCDAFTPASSTATLLGAGSIALLAIATPILGTRASRLAAAGVAGGGAAGLAAVAYPVCLTGPYGPMDPWLYEVWMRNVLEARGVFFDRAMTAIPNIGLMFTATATSLWVIAKRPLLGWRMAPAALVLATSVVVALVQMRGVYIGAAVAAPLLAPLLLAARRGGRPLAVAGAWIASTGILYLVVPATIDQRLTPAARTNFLKLQDCKGRSALAALDRLPAGVIMAPLDVGAYSIGATHHSAVAAGYHRNNRGNRAMYDFFLGIPDQSREIAARWNVDYVAICETDFGEIDVRRSFPESLAARLLTDGQPDWLQRLPNPDKSLQLYRVRR